MLKGNRRKSGVALSFTQPSTCRKKLDNTSSAHTPHCDEVTAGTLLMGNLLDECRRLDKPYFSVCVRSFVRSFVRPSVRSFLLSFARSFVRSFVRSFLLSFALSFVRSFVRPFVPSFVRSFVRPSVRPSVRSCTCDAEMAS
jgi:hypothetical protein